MCSESYWSVERGWWFNFLTTVPGQFSFNPSLPESVDLSSVIESPLLGWLRGSEVGRLGLGSCGELGRDGFHEVVKIEAGFSAGGFIGIWGCVRSSWVWLLNFEEILYVVLKKDVSELPPFQEGCNYHAEKLCLERNVYFHCSPNSWKVFKVLIHNAFLLFWYR